MAHYILVSGKARHGKSIVADILKELIEEDGGKAFILAYGDKVKEIARTFYSWDGEKDVEGRRLLQMIGDDDWKIKRNNKYYYVEHIITLAKYILEDDEYALIPDARYPFEIDRVRDGLENGDTLHSIRVNRPNFESDLTEEQLKHASETSLDNYNRFDYHIENISIEELAVDVLRVYKDILKNIQEVSL